MESAPCEMAQTRSRSAVPDAGVVCPEERVTNSEVVLTSRFHGLINFLVIIYTKEVYGFVDSWDDSLLV